MTTLQNLCFENIAKTISNAPPLIQEMVIDETKQRIERKMEKKIEKKYIAYNSSISFLVPEIMTDIINSMTNNTLRKDFRSIYSNLPKHIIECAILTAENCVRDLDDRYFHNIMSVQNQHSNFYDEYSDSQEIDYPDSDFLWNW